MIISGKQCKAARALLDWHISDLAEHAGVNEATITAFENEKKKPHLGTVEKIQQTMKKFGIEFGPNNRVEIDNNPVRFIESEHALTTLLDEMVEAMAQEGGSKEIFHCNVIESLSPPAVFQKRAKLKELGAEFKFFIEEGDTKFYGDTKNYRYMPSEHFSSQLVYVFGNKVAFIMQDALDVCIVLENAHNAEGMRKILRSLWERLPTPVERSVKQKY